MSMRAWPPVSVASSCSEALLRPGRPIESASGGRMGSERQVAQLALDAIAQRRVERAVPARPQLRDHAARADVGEQLAQRSADRHARRDLGHHADVEALGIELAAGDVAGFVLAPDDAHVALRPAQAVAGAKAELAHGDAGPVVALLRIDAPGDLLELERLDRLVEAQRDRAQGEVDRGARRLAVLQLEPAAQRAVAFAQLERQGDVAAQLAQLGARQVGVDRGRSSAASRCCARTAAGRSGRAR